MILINSSTQDALKIFQPFLPIYVPIGLGYLLAAAEQKGIHAYLIDEQVEDNTFELIDQYTKTMERPYIFGFSVLTATFKRALFVAQRLKELYPDSFVCFGGVHPTALPEEVLSYQQVDVVVRGEAEHILPKLYWAVKTGKDFSHLDSLSFRTHGQIIHNNRAPVLKDLDSLPPFPYHRFTSECYDLGFVLSSRGCPYDCIFCSNRVTTGKNYRFRAAEGIINELEMLYEKYAIRSVHFHDDNLLVNKKRIYRLLEALQKKNFHKNMIFSFQARGDNVDYDVLKRMYDNGFRSVFFGLETTSERIMKLLKKGETVAQCIEAVGIAKQIGFHVSATFIFALPTETHQDRMLAARLSKTLELDLVRFNNATPYPGTELYEIAQKTGRLHVQGIYENFNSVSTFIENPFRKIPFSYVPEGESEENIRQDILLSYLTFYLHIKRIRQVLTKPDQGVGWFSLGRQTLEQLKQLPALLVLAGILFFKFGELFLKIVLRKNTSISISECIELLVGNGGDKTHGNREQNTQERGIGTGEPLTK